MAEEWNWTVIADTLIFTPEGVISLAHDSKACVLHHAKKGWERWMMRKDNRGGAGPHSLERMEPCRIAHRNWSKRDMLRRSCAWGAAPDASKAFTPAACRAFER